MKDDLLKSHKVGMHEFSFMSGGRSKRRSEIGESLYANYLPHIFIRKSLYIRTNSLVSFSSALSIAPESKHKVTHAAYVTC